MFAGVIIIAEGDLADIVVERMEFRVGVVVCLVGSNSLVVPFASENAAATGLLEAATNSAYSGEQVDEVEVVIGMVRGGRR